MAEWTAALSAEVEQNTCLGEDVLFPRAVGLEPRFDLTE
jgi:hypothetical protein